ncbi:MULTISPECIES: type IV secretion system protein [unclassified Neisseria]|uniref:type IV secretion system protein n=1 Tax=unclassified Neisseria TaxID=2623750 RepID=UPI001071A408|nr:MULTISPECIES: type IV secretion system protein [unclassified Neisseria]MBF0805005.1 conjugal transfer protein TraF [Neisseria sp. 19428wB4_WF04]TFU39266.1 conjugal transfer protein TraF [Neisseria sp. WF04]
MKSSTIKKAAAAVAVGLMVSAAPAIAGGIPVFDGAAVAQAVQQGIQMGQQIENQVKQITELKNQVKALTGNRNFGNILKTEALEQLPDEWKSVYDAAIQAKKGNFNDLLGSKGYNQNADNDRLVKHFDLTLKAIKDSELRFQNIKALMNRVNTTQDAKAAADLQNRIALENAYIQQNQTRLDMMERFMVLDEKVQVKKRQARDRCIRENRINGTNKSCT